MTKRTPQSNDPKGSPKRRRLRRVLLVIAAGIAGLLVMVLGITQTAWFRAEVRVMIEKKAGDALHATLAIGELDGSLFTSFELHSVVLALGPDTVLTVDRVRAKYRFWPILSRRLRVDSLAVEHPVFYMQRLLDGHGDTGRQATGDRRDAAQAEHGGLPLTVDADHIVLDGGKIITGSLNDKIPEEIRDISMRASASVGDSLRRFSLLHLSLVAREPEFHLRGLSFEAVQDENGVTVRDLSIRTAQNRISASAEYGEPVDRAASAEVEADSLSLREFDFLLGEFRLGVSPALSMDLHVQRDTLSVSAGLRASGQRLGVEAILSNIGIWEEAPESTGIHYDVHVSLQGVDPELWLGRASVASRINGSLVVSGGGLSPASADATVEGRFHDSVLRSRTIDSLNVSARYRRGDATFRLSLQAPSGRSTLSGSLLNLTTKPRYNVKAAFHGLDLSLAAAETSWKSDLNGRLSIKGAGFDPKHLQAEVLLQLAASSFAAYEADTVAAQGNIRDGLIDLSQLLLETGGLGISARAKGSLRDNSFAAGGEVRIDGTDLFAKYVPFREFDASGRIPWSAAGRIDSLTGEARPALARIRMDATTVDSLSGSAECTVVKGRPPAVRSQWEIYGAVRPKLPPVDRLSAGVELNGDSLAVAADLNSGNLLRLHVESALRTGAETDIVLRALDVRYRNQEWEQIEAPARIRIDSIGYAVDRLVVRSGANEGETASRLAVHGVFATRGRHDFHITGSNLDVSKLTALYDSSLAVSGDLFLRADLEGNVKQPSSSLWASVRNGKAMGIRFDSLSTRLALEKDSLDVAARIAFVDYPPLRINGYVPVHLPPEGGDILPSDEPLSVQVHADSLPLGLVRMVTRRNIEEISGYAACSLSVGNTIANPEFSGGAEVLCSRLAMPQYGVDYRDIGAYITLGGNRIQLDSLRIYREKGTFIASANTEWRSGLTSGKLESMSMKFRANQFPAVRHKYYDLEISGGMNAEISADSARFGGNITVLRSRLYLPAVTGNTRTSAATDPNETSMLVEAIRDTAGTGVRPSGTVLKMGPEAPPLATSNLYRRLQGTVKLNLPRNTWITSPDMSMELQGSLDIVKRRLQPELFGSIRVVRGYYELYGRRFRVEEGELIFQGGTDLNPHLAITTTYRFRDPDRVQRELVLTIKGTARMPELTFQVDGTEVPEGDAMAFILFGRSFDSLTFGQRGTVAQTSGGEGSLASKFASGFLAGQIEKQLGRELNLDVIEIQAQEDWSGASFEVGKYLTNDLFVSYQSGFGTTVDNELIPREVTLEYELTPSLFLRLIESDTRSTGFDLIWRLQRD